MITMFAIVESRQYTTGNLNELSHENIRSDNKRLELEQTIKIDEEFFYIQKKKLFLKMKTHRNSKFYSMSSELSVLSLSDEVQTNC